MAELNAPVTHILHVIDLNGNNVTGLVLGDFTTELKRWNGTALVSVADSVAIAEVGAISDPGIYTATYTPTEAEGLHRLVVTELTNGNNPDSMELAHEYQDIVADPGAAAGTAGPYLTTRARVRQALAIKGDDDTETGDNATEDPRIDGLLGPATDWIHKRTGRYFPLRYNTLVTEGTGDGTLILPDHPAVDVVSVHVNTDSPRTYDAADLLTPATDYVVDLPCGLVERIDGGLFPSAPQSVQVIYLAGYETIPESLNQAAVDLIASWYPRLKHQQMHVKGERVGEGGISTLELGAMIPDTVTKALGAWARAA